jgi:hypothetical protein
VTLTPWRFSAEGARQLRLDQVVLWESGGGGDWPEWLCLPKKGAGPPSLSAVGDANRPIPLKPLDSKPSDAHPCPCCFLADSPKVRFTRAKSACREASLDSVAPEYRTMRKDTEGKPCSPSYCK